MSIALLALLFLLTALLYSSVGFGGGSTYIALLVLGGMALEEVPVVALACNIAVVTTGTLRFAREGLVGWRRILPLVALSVPFAWLGGFLAVPAWLFVGLLAVMLLAASLLMIAQRDITAEPAPRRVAGPGTDMVTGAALGLLAGVTGIGGGIYLSPLLHLRRWAEARRIAATCAVFILVNSIAGIAGHAGRLGLAETGDILSRHALLLPAVIAGGLAGSTLGVRWISQRHLRLLTALLVLYVAVRLGLRFPAEWAAR